MLKKMVTTVYVDDLTNAKAFYCNLLGLTAGFETDGLFNYPHQKTQPLS